MYMASRYAVMDDCRMQIREYRLHSRSTGSDLNRRASRVSHFDKFGPEMAPRNAPLIWRKSVAALALSVLFAASQLGLVTADEKGASGQPVYQVAKLRMMARVYMACGTYSEARQLAQRALQTAKTQNASDVELCACRLDLAYLYNEVGEYDEAEVQCRLGIELQQKLYSEKYPNVADALRIMTAILREQGRYEDARVALEQAATIMQEHHEQESREMIPLEIEKARLLFKEGAVDTAESCYLETLKSIDRIFGPDHAYTARIQVELAALYVCQRRYNQAERLVLAASQVQEKIYGPDHHFLIPAWLVMAHVHHARGDNTQTRKMIQKSMLVARNKLEPTHPLTRKVLSESKILGSEDSD